MSSILEALERAEQERNARGGTPLHEPLSRPKRWWQQPGVWLFGVGLLLLNLLVWWLMFDTGEPPRIARVEPEQAKLATQPETQPPTLSESPLLDETRLAARVSPPPVVQPVAPLKPIQTAPVKADRVTVPPLLETVSRPAPAPLKPVTATKAQPVLRQPVSPPPATTEVASREPEVPVTQPPEPVTPSAKSPAVAQQPVAETKKASVPPLLEAVARPAPAPATPVPAVAKAQPAAKQPAVPRPATTVASTDKLAPVAEAAEPIKPLAKPPALKQEPAEAPKVSVPLESTVLEAPVPEPVVAQAPAEIEVEAVAEEEERVPEIWELPEAVQLRLKNLKINIHVYNEVPAQRFVIIEMRRYREGDPLARAGLKLERITREGVVINYGKGLVKI